MYLLKHRLSDGAIVASWSANDAALLTPNVVSDDPVHGYHLEESLLTPQQLAERCYVADGALQAKAEVTITATPPTFLADGVASSTITVTPFVPCTVQVSSVPFVLTPEDATVVLTADVPQVFVLELAPHATVWAALQTVEAT